MKLSNVLKNSWSLLIAALALTPQLAWGDIKCPKFDSSDRDAVLQQLFNEIKPDALNADTIEKQDAVFDCLESLINSAIASSSGKKPNVESIKPLVFWSAKSMAYKNDVDSAEFNAGLNKKVFKPHRKLVVKALQILEKDKSLSSEELKAFKELNH